MKKLNPFQMPQETESSLNNTIPPSTSHDTNPTNVVPSECEKENFPRENQFENGSECRAALINNENIPQVNGVTSENSNMPDIFNVVLLEQQQQGMNESRPRQYGRRSNPVRISSLAADSLNHSAAVIFHFFVLI